MSVPLLLDRAKVDAALTALGIKGTGACRVLLLPNAVEVTYFEVDANGKKFLVGDELATRTDRYSVYRPRS